MAEEKKIQIQLTSEELRLVRLSITSKMEVTPKGHKVYVELDKLVNGIDKQVWKLN